MEARRPAAEPRKLVCTGCGAAFDCTLGGECWCSAEPFRLPLPEAASAEDCLCQLCLRARAAQQRVAADPLK